MKTLLKNARIYENENLTGTITVSFGGKIIRDLKVIIDGGQTKATTYTDELSIMVIDDKNKLRHIISLLDGEVKTEDISDRETYHATTNWGEIGSGND